MMAGIRLEEPVSLEPVNPRPHDLVPACWRATSSGRGGNPHRR